MLSFIIKPECDKKLENATATPSNLDQGTFLRVEGTGYGKLL